jgi:hypothetical protein
LAAIRTLTDDRPTCGYRRICALVDRQRQSAAIAPVNPKRIYRLMSQNGLLLLGYTGKPPRRARESQIITIRLNLRWTSDGFEIACWNGEVVRIAFGLDTCDREVMSWIATIGGVSGEMIRDLMLESVEKRIGSPENVPYEIEWLSDNGSCTALTRRSHSPNRSVASRASRRCDRRIRIGWPSPSSKSSSGITFMLMIARMHNRFWNNFLGGSRTTAKTIRTTPCE